VDNLISIIIPVYNSSLYLCDCIQSVLQQTWKNFELILVDDGSQDESKSICKKISSTDNKIQFIEQKHKGVSAARNAALEVASGKYLFFLDSDDVIHPCLLETLYTVLYKTNAVMAASEYQFIKAKERLENSDKSIPSSCSDEYIYLDNQASIDLFVQGHTNILYGTGGIMIRSTKVHSLRFDERLLNGEDTKFVYQALLKGADITILNKKWYYYRRYEGNSCKKRTLNACKSMYRCESYIRDSELKHRRLLNAIAKEQILMNRICEWYITGLRSHDTALCSYLRKMFTKESSNKIFYLTCLHNKITFYLTFHCRPLYWMYHWLHKLHNHFFNLILANTEEKSSRLKLPHGMKTLLSYKIKSENRKWKF